MARAVAVTGWRKRARRTQVAVKCLISLKTTGEQEPLRSTVGRGGARRPTPGGGLAIEMLFRDRGPLRATKGLIFFGEFKNVGAVRAVWKELGFGWAGSSVRAGCNGNSGCNGSSCNEK